MFEGMATSANPNYGQSTGATSIPSRPTSSHASAGHMHSSTPVVAAVSHAVNPRTPLPSVPANAFQKAIQIYVGELSVDDKVAFLSAPSVIERLKEIQCNEQSPISSSHLVRVEKVLQSVKQFMCSLAIFIQHSPEISSLVVGGVNCILMVGTSSYLFMCSLIHVLIYQYWVACFG